MVTVLEVSDGVVHHTSLEHMNFHNIKWLDMEDPSDVELQKLSGIVGLSKRELEGLIDRDEFSRMYEAEHFSVVVCKAPYEPKRKSHLIATTLTFFVSERLLITLHKDPIIGIDKTLKLPKDRLAQLLQLGTSELFSELLQQLAAEFFTRLDAIEELIDKIEDTVFTSPNQKSVKKIFSIKRSLIYFHKSLAANRDILITLQKEAVGVQVRKSARLTNLYYDFVQLLDVVATYRDILTGTLDIYLSSVSNNMNAVMKKMSAYGSLVLVPTFITGLYGMNFRFMPELSWQYGYLFAWGVIIVSLLLLWWYFKKKDWF